MTRLFIPPLGTEIELAADWHFRLFDEHRNDKMINLLAPPRPQRAIDGFWGLSREERADAMNESGWEREGGPFQPGDDHSCYGVAKFAPIMLPAGTKLKIQRIYIRQGQKGFDSVTFTVSGLPADAADKVPALAKKKPKDVGRFWVKLEDANQMAVTSPIEPVFPAEIHFSHSVADDEKFNADGLFFLGAGICDGKEVHCFARPSAVARK